MKAILEKISKKEVSLFVCCLFMVALIYSKFLLTVCMVLFLLMIVFEYKAQSAFPFSINSKLKENFQSYLKATPFVLLTIFFFLVFFSVVYSTDMDYWLERVRIKLPFLVLPFAFFSLPKFTQRDFYGLLVFLLFLMLFSSSDVLIHYFNNYTAITENIGKGQSIPTPMNHIRYSLLLAFSIVCGFILYANGFYLKYKWEPKLILFASLLLFLFIHILSVRSGLLALYISMILMCVFVILKTKKYIVGCIGFLVISSLPVIAYKTVPSFKIKIEYALYDFQQFQLGKGQGYSDSERLISLSKGWDIFKEHPILGIGAGDLRSEMQLRYANENPGIKQWKMPHNQFISVMAGNGIVGLCLFLIALFYPLFYRKNYKEPIFLAFYVIACISFLMENTIENAIGVAFFIFFLLLNMKYLYFKDAEKRNISIT